VGAGFFFATAALVLDFLAGALLVDCASAADPTSESDSRKRTSWAGRRKGVWSTGEIPASSVGIGADVYLGISVL
jgi:hypothetical protein